MTNASTGDSWQTMIDWLHRRSLAGWDVHTLLAELVDQLQTLGMPMYRVHIGLPMLHPLYAVGAYTWFRGSGVEVDQYARGTNDKDFWRRSAIRPIYESGALEGRYRIKAGTESDRFPMFVQAAAEGGTDYYLQLTGFDERSKPPDEQEGIVLSWTSASPDGFRPCDIELLERLRVPLCAQLKSLTQQRLVSDILQAYLGGYSADRVRAGQIQLGDGDEIDAVILFCDLRGSSTLAEHYDLHGFLGVLNDYYAITAGAVIEGGGEVLRYIGDASLAIFPFERYESETKACEAAMNVALDALARGQRINAERSARREPPLEFGIGMHTGRVMYGNIGTRERIEFTVIGKAANEAARIEAKCKELARTVRVSDDFAARLPRAWRSHGLFELRNIGRAIEILSPRLPGEPRVEGEDAHEG